MSGSSTSKVSSSQSDMKLLKVKETESVDFSPFGPYIEENFGESAESVAGEIKQLTNLRENSCRGINAKDVGAKDMLLKYYGQLEYAELRFPMNESNIQIIFKWKDTLSDTYLQQYSVAYEKANVLFNIAAVQSSIAVNQDRFSESGLKAACNYFQFAAGTLEFLSANFMHAPTKDMNRDCLRYLISFLLAQAQECFWEKSVLDKKSRKVISKLAQQTSKSYATCIDILSESSFASSLDKTWNGLSTMKKIHFASVAQYHMAIACHEDDGYGEEIARLEKARSYAEEAMALTKQWASSLTGTVDAIKMNHNLIVSRKTVAEKDNDTIYHELVPSSDRLEDIEPLEMVSATPFLKDLREVAGDDIFGRLIPLSVHEASSLYSEELAKIQRQTSEMIGMKNDELEDAMSSMGLPEDVLSYGLAPAIPNDIVPLCKIVKEDYNVSQLDELFQEMAGLNNRCCRTLDEVERVLKDCEQQGEAMQYNHGSQWIVTKEIRGLEEQCSGVKNEADHHRKTLEKALESDRRLSDLFSQHVVNIKLLGSSESEMVRHIPSPNLMDSSVEEANVERLRELCGKVEIMKGQRRDLEKKLKTQLASDDITTKLIYYEKRKNQRDEFFALEKSKHDELLTQINQNLDAQTNVLEAIVTENGNFRAARLSERDVESEKAVFLHSLKESFEIASDISKNLKGGVAFYRQFVDVVDECAAKCFKICNELGLKRETLSNDLEQESLDQKVEKVHISGDNNLNNVQNDRNLHHSSSASAPFDSTIAVRNCPPPLPRAGLEPAAGMHSELSSVSRESFPPLTDPLKASPASVAPQGTENVNIVNVNQNTYTSSSENNSTAVDRPLNDMPLAPALDLRPIVPEYSASEGQTMPQNEIRNPTASVGEPMPPIPTARPQIPEPITPVKYVPPPSAKEVNSMSNGALNLSQMADIGLNEFDSLIDDALTHATDGMGNAVPGDSKEPRVEHAEATVSGKRGDNMGTEAGKGAAGPLPTEQHSENISIHEPESKHQQSNESVPQTYASPSAEMQPMKNSPQVDSANVQPQAVTLDPGYMAIPPGQSTLGQASSVSTVTGCTEQPDYGVQQAFQNSVASQQSRTPVQTAPLQGGRMPPQTLGNANPQFGQSVLIDQNPQMQNTIDHSQQGVPIVTGQVAGPSPGYGTGYAHPPQPPMVTASHSSAEALQLPSNFNRNAPRQQGPSTPISNSQPNMAVGIGPQAVPAQVNQPVGTQPSVAARPGSVGQSGGGPSYFGNQVSGSSIVPPAPVNATGSSTVMAENAIQNGNESVYGARDSYLLAGPSHHPYSNSPLNANATHIAEKNMGVRNFDLNSRSDSGNHEHTNVSIPATSQYDFGQMNFPPQAGIQQSQCERGGAPNMQNPKPYGAYTTMGHQGYGNATSQQESVGQYSRPGYGGPHVMNPMGNDGSVKQYGSTSPLTAQPYVDRSSKQGYYQSQRGNTASPSVPPRPPKPSPYTPSNGAPQVPPRLAPNMPSSAKPAPVVPQRLSDNEKANLSGRRY
eukprot:Nk52_evm8s1020 gene=Nk52_evmTU8s1020